MNRSHKRTGPGWFQILAVAGGILFLIAVGNSLQQSRRVGPGHPAWDALNAWVGQSAPELAVQDLFGQEWKLSELKGRRVFLVFWGTSCVPCLKEIPHLSRLQDELPPEQFQILALTGDDSGYLNENRVLERLKIPYPVISYSGQIDAVVRPYRDVSLLPTLIIVDAQGTIEQVVIGTRDYSELKRLALGEVPS